MRFKFLATTTVDSESRNVLLDIVKGLAIILVVFGHVERGISDSNGLTAFYSIVDLTLYTFHMPVFFFLSGYNIFNSLFKRGCSDFIKSRFWSIVYPYLVWSSLFIFSQYIAASFTAINHPTHIKSIFTLFYEPKSIFWFLYALFFMHVISFLFKNKIFLLLIVSLIVDFVFTFVWEQKSILSQFAFHFPFFALGVYMRSANYSIACDSILYKRNLILSLFVFIVGVLLLGNFDSQPVAFSSLIISLSGVYLTFVFASNVERFSVFSKLFYYIGRHSFHVYILHIFVLPIIFRLFKSLMLSHELLFSAISTFASIFISILIFRLLSSIGLQHILALSGKSFLTLKN